MAFQADDSSAMTKVLSRQDQQIEIDDIIRRFENGRQLVSVEIRAGQDGEKSVLTLDPINRHYEWFRFSEIHSIVMKYVIPSRRR